MGKAIGIDLGTTNSATAVLIDGKPHVIRNAEGSFLTPSVVAFTKDGSRLIGQPAKDQSVTNPDRTIWAIRRKIGTNYKVNIDGIIFEPRDFLVMLVQKLKLDAENYLGEKVTRAVITVPTYFNYLQRQDVFNACKIAGLDIMRMISEQSAIGILHALGQQDMQKVLVVNIGGGFTGISALEISENLVIVSAATGIQVGGNDIDQCLAKYVFDEFKKKYGANLFEERLAKQLVYEAVEKAKELLTYLDSTHVNIPYITAGQEGLMGVCCKLDLPGIAG